MDYVSEVINKFAPINGIGILPSKNIEEIVKNLLSNQNVICIKEEGKGLILGLIYPLYYNPDVLIAQELGWWVEPEYRNTTLGIKLLKKFEKEAIKKGASKIMMIYLEAQNPGKMKNMYERLMYRPVEHTMIKDL
jgi:GNAT superfamily N-acetyltransferase